MAVTKSGYVIRFIAGDQDIAAEADTVISVRGGIRVIGVLIVAAAAAAHLKLYDADNSVAGVAVFEFGDVSVNTTDGATGILVQFRTGISATLTGAGAVAYLFCA